jgi:hypothetical protein
VRVQGEPQGAGSSQPARRQAAGGADTPMRTRTCCRACSHRRSAPMRSPPSYLALPLDSSCSACTRPRVVGVGVKTCRRQRERGTCGVGDAARCWLRTSLQGHASSTCCLMRTSTDARQGVSCRRRAAERAGGGRRGRVREVAGRCHPADRAMQCTRSTPGGDSHGSHLLQAAAAAAHLLL